MPEDRILSCMKSQLEKLRGEKANIWEEIQHLPLGKSSAKRSLLAQHNQKQMAIQKLEGKIEDRKRELKKK